MGIKEDNCFQTSKLCVVQLDLFEGRHQFVHDPDPNVSDHGILRFCHPKSTPLSDISGYDHIVAKQKNVVKIHGSSSQTEKQMFSSMSAKQSNLLQSVIMIFFGGLIGFYLVIKNKFTKCLNVFCPFDEYEKLLFHGLANIRNACKPLCADIIFIQFHAYIKTISSLSLNVFKHL